ncbi:MAG: DUF3592 domain-containing protein [Phycisphaerales bacterium]
MSIVCFVVVILCVFATINWLLCHLAAMRSSQWLAVDAVVIGHSKPRRQDLFWFMGPRPHVLVPSYRYSFQGIEYASDAYRPIPIAPTRTDSPAEVAAKRFPISTPLRVFVDPMSPASSCVVPGSRSGMSHYAGPTLSLVIAAVFAPVSVYMFRRAQQIRSASQDSQDVAADQPRHFQ